MMKTLLTNHAFAFVLSLNHGPGSEEKKTQNKTGVLLFLL